MSPERIIAPEEQLDEVTIPEFNLVLDALRSLHPRSITDIAEETGVEALSVAAVVQHTSLAQETELYDDSGEPLYMLTKDEIDQLS